TYFLAWTTTPWTLPANVALAVNPDAIYVKARVSETGEEFIFADGLTSSVLRLFFPLPMNGDVSFEIIEKMKGSQLVGLEYEPLYPLSPEALQRLTAREGNTRFRVVAMKYVSIDDGTGIVHTAPAFGEEDFFASKTHGLPVIVTVDEEGHQRPELGIAAGLPIKKSDPVIIADLQARGLLFRREQITHSVPICWRCNTQLLYKAQSAWFVNVTKLKPKLLGAAKKIQWHPEHLKAGRFGKGLETAPDWCISRTRYWGAPLPVWCCDACGNPRVFGSIAELESASGTKIQSGKDGLGLHRPAIDEISVTCACGGRASRIPDVFDCWYESGSMPFASMHYPFEHKKWFDAHFPADFIAEGQDQTRGWFYSMHVLATALAGKPAFRNALVTGLIMAEDGKKMSKSLKNYPDPWDLMTRLGTDTLRLYLLSSPVVAAEQLNFSERDCETIQRTLFGTLWNVRAFYLLVAGQQIIARKKPRSAHVLDRWLLARLARISDEMTSAMESYDLIAATRPLRGWVDDFSTWWLRRSRERLKSDDSYERMDALCTFREALLTTAELLAPFAPFFSEKLYQDVNGPKMSVHLERWPKADRRLIDAQLLDDMTWVRAVAASAHELRSRHKIPVRQALASLTVKLADASRASRVTSRSEFLSLLRDETNVEQVIIASGVDSGAESWTVELDTRITPELQKKGFARELSRRIMNLRKSLRLAPSDRILLSFTTDDAAVRTLLETFASDLGKETGAIRVSVGESIAATPAHEETLEFDGQTVHVAVTKA
ncbi:MAG: class I tRNA ligase family protein, partial [Patescibacteria group bacterium]